jgi:hypothetical protein
MKPLDHIPEAVLPAYRAIKEYYGDKKAERSQVPYINHIEEGLSVLWNTAGSTDLAMSAYCLHPILQSDEDFSRNFDGSLLKGIDPGAIILCVEYRRVANSYLSKNKKEDVVNPIHPQVKAMLVADKIQNYKDFMLHHAETHPRRRELFDYFHNWFEILQLDGEQVVNLLRLIGYGVK